MTLHDKRQDMNIMFMYPEKDVKEAVKELIERIKINGNLSNHIIETEDGEFQHRHNFELNNIVIEVIEEIFGEGLIQNSEDKKDGN